MSNDARQVLDHLRKKGWVYSSAQGSSHVRQALRNVDFPQLLEMVGEIKAEAGGAERCVVEIYKEWLQSNAGRSAVLFAGWFNLGVELVNAGDENGAITCYRNALTLKSDCYQASVNLGLALERQGKVAEALDTWTKAVQPDDARTTLLNHSGRMLEMHKDFKQAEEKLYTSLLTVPRQPEALEHWIHLRQKMCAWPEFGDGIPGLTEAELRLAPGALSILAMTDDLATQSTVVKTWLDKKVPPVPARLTVEGQRYGHRKIRLGYMSSDYCRHPVSYLVAELFERHDRENFEVYGYCSTNDDGSDVRARIIKAFDKFVSIKGMSDEQAAQAIRADEIDILIDLNGVTAGTRMHVLRWRPAPVQVTYLGYIGPIPMPELDYFLCDDFVVPPEMAPHYQPKPLYIPGVYQVNDSKLAVGETPTRQQVGLPDDKFVFCCFSNNYKITEEMFGAWMTILDRSPNAVLWLLADNDWCRVNMIAQAGKRGIDPARLIFAGRVDPSLYLARMKAADLFLDTFPYNAGTTASDALRVGLPLVTRCGQSFVSRMAGCLSRAVGLEGGVTHSLPEYIDRAAHFANDPQAYQDFRKSLDGDAWARTIGNIEAFTPRLEQVYRSVFKG